jgi:hypothetical protein
LGRLGTLALAACLAGCEQQLEPTATGSFSSVYTAFNPVAEFERAGIQVDMDVYAGRLSPREMYSWKPFQGSLVLPQEKSGCEWVAQAIRHAVERALGGECEDELTPVFQRPRGRSFYGMLRYTQQEMHGCVYVWLFPNESETEMSYAILVREEREPDRAKMDYATMR